MADARLGAALQLIHARARPGELAGMARFAIVGAGRLGLSVPDMRRIARTLGQDHALALALWRTGIPDARIVAAHVCEPARLTSRQMDAWIRDFESWDVCDQVCANAFARSPLAWDKVAAWAGRTREFERRAAFALLAALAVHDRQAPDERFEAALPLVEAASDDARNFVRKAVNWALRNIGKRNRRLNLAAITCALRIRQRPNRAARWVASDALRELQGPAQQARLKA